MSHRNSKRKGRTKAVSPEDAQSTEARERRLRRRLRGRRPHMLRSLRKPWGVVEA